MHEVAYYGDTAKFQLLLDEGMDIRAKTKKTYFSLNFFYNNGGLTALHIAAANFNTSLMQLILENGANIEDTDDDGETALHKVPCAAGGLGVRRFDA